MFFETGGRECYCAYLLEEEEESQFQWKSQLTKSSLDLRGNIYWGVKVCKMLEKSG